MLGYGLTLAAVIAVAFYLIFLHRPWRRKRLAEQPFPDTWRALLNQHMVLYRRLPEDRREKLHRDIRILLDEVRFYGCAGLELTDTMRLVIAAHGALLINGLSPDYYRELKSVLVYPGAYRVREQVLDGHVLTHTEQDRLGESWEAGRVIVAWETLKREAADPQSTSNVGLHEFSHQLDQLDGTADGAPPLASGSLATQWQAVFAEAWERRQHLGGDSVIDEYGAESPAEFFAVASEAFFLAPTPLREQEPELYRCLQAFYRLSPADWRCSASIT